LAVLGSGACFGELSVIDGAPRSADVTAIERTECLVLDSSAVKKAAEAAPSLSWHLLRHLAHTVRAQNETVEAFASRDVAGRLANVLLRLAEQHGVPSSDGNGVRIAVPLTKTDLKSFVGATREHVTNIMTEFTKLGYIATDEETGHFVVRKADELGRRAQF
jgi:CRP-like cAMP-binding protein